MPVPASVGGAAAGSPGAAVVSGSGLPTSSQASAVGPLPSTPPGHPGGPGSLGPP